MPESMNSVEQMMALHFWSALALLLAYVIYVRFFRRWVRWRIARNECRRRHRARFVCPHCVRRIHEREVLCHRCRQPVSSYSAIGPIEEIAAKGNLYRRAVRSNRLIAPIGLWFLALPSMLWVRVSVRWVGDGVELSELLLSLIVLFPALLAAKGTWYFVMHRSATESVVTED